MNYFFKKGEKPKYFIPAVAASKRKEGLISKYIMIRNAEINNMFQISFDSLKA